MKKEELLKFYQKYKLYIFPSIVVLSSLILIIFVIFPQIVKLLDNQKVEKEIQNKSKFLEAKAQSLETYDLEDLNRKVNFALSAYPTDRDAVNAISLIQGLISPLGFNILSINLGSSAAKSTKEQSYGFKLELQGPVSLIQSLLSALDNSPRLIRVSSVDITTAGVSQAANVSLAVDMLYAAAPAGFGSVDSPLPELTEKDEEVIAKLARLGAPTPQTQAPAQLGPRGKANPFE